MAQSDTKETPWKEPLLMSMGATCYLKFPYSMKQQYPGAKNQNPEYRITKGDNNVELTFTWKLDENGKIIDDKLEE